MEDDHFYYLNRHGHEFVQDLGDAMRLKNTLDDLDLEYKMKYETDDDAGFLFEISKMD
jgi:hypothetical protein